MCKGTLNLYCLDCSHMIAWRKEHVIRDDGYYDWRVVAECGCGEIRDPEVLTMARAAFDRKTGRSIFERQEAAMEKIFGAPFHRALNERIRSMFEI